jgi:diguanylate cyclase (GGDEF)-like protein/excisionase family DNA binding protein
MLTVTGAARLLGVHPNTVRAWADGGRLRCVRINERGDRRFATSDLQAFLAAGTTGQAAPPSAGSDQPPRLDRMDGGTGGGSHRALEDQLAVWGEQLRSIQKLGTRLGRLSTVAEIGHAICTELRQLIDYHNVRVYRVQGNDGVPVAWRGDMGEYVGEFGEQLRVRVGQGITGWVAEHGIAEYLPDAAKDPRAATIPGTEPDLDESMILAPMRFDDRIIGVIVLSKLGVDQFTRDDLRYLEIYASMAAQAMANADTTQLLRAQSELLARQLEAQRELMRATESILSTLDPRAVMEEIAERVGGLVPVDVLALTVRRPATGALQTLFSRGADPDMLLPEAHPDAQAVNDWVFRHAETLRLQADVQDPRAIRLARAWQPDALIVAPLRGPEGVTGTLALARRGPGARFDDTELELIELFAGHVSIALQNAGEHQAAELRAQTDSLTGLKNQGTFKDHMHRWVGRGAPFSLLILDLDGFKAFNDESGHEAGNLLLTEIADSLRAACRDSDEVFRYGGDEFALILPGTEEAGALEVAARIARAVRGMGANDRGYRGISCSVGVATFPVDASDQAEMVLAADRACYAAKRAGRDRIATAKEGLAFAGPAGLGAQEASVIGREAPVSGDAPVSGHAPGSREPVLAGAGARPAPN